MDKREKLKKSLKPIVKECITEVLIEQGLLSDVIAEVVKGLAPLTEQRRPVQVAADPKPVYNQINQNNTMSQQPDYIREQRAELERQKREMMAERANNIAEVAGLPSGIFSDTEPLVESGDSKVFEGVAPNDPGVDLSALQILAGRNWKDVLDKSNKQK